MGQETKNRIYAEKARDGITILIAGAGSGKTSTLIKRAVSSLDSQCREEEVLILAFNRGAAREIRERLFRTLGISGIEVYTFHAFAYFLLKKYAVQFLNFSGFSVFPAIIDEDEVISIINKAVETKIRLFRGLPVPVITDIVMNIDSLPDWIWKKLYVSGISEEIIALSEYIKDYRVENGVITFDEIIEYAISFLESRRDIREEVMKSYRYILVDEFQDLAESNFRLLRTVFDEKNCSLFAVGDDWQSIYGFRGAHIDYILRPGRYFIHPEVIKFRLNCRSKKEIVSLSNSFIKKNKKRTARRILSARGSGGRVIHYHVKNFEEELGILGEIILTVKREFNGSIGVLYRNNWQGERIQNHIESHLRENISFMTFHKSKGLEFDSVILAGVSDRIIPDRMSDVEEERRLFYVAMTRARDNLILVLHHDEKGRLGRFGRELGF